MDETLVALDRCQAAAFDDSKWAEALDHLAWAVGANGCSFVNRAPPERRHLLPASPRYGEFVRDFVAEGWAASDHRARRGWPLLRGGGVVLLEQDVSSEEERDTLPVYRDLYSRHDLYWWASASFLVGDDLWAISFLRSRAAGPFLSDDAKRIGRIAPHVGMIVRARMAAAQSAAGDVVRAMEYTGNPAIIIADDGSVLAMNPGAQALLGGGIGITGGRLHMGVAEFREVLRQLRDGNSTGTSLPMTIADRDNVPIVVDVMPRAVSGQAFNGPTALVMLRSLAQPKPTGERRLRRIFALTPAEARFADALSAGVSVQGAADQLGIASETGRSHLRSIFTKTGTNHQRNLVALLQRVARRQ